MRIRSMGSDRNGTTADVLFEAADQSTPIEGIGTKQMRVGDWHDLQSGDTEVRITANDMWFIDGTDQMAFEFTVLQRELEL